MADPAVHLGLYMQLVAKRDSTAGAAEPLLRDRLTVEALRALRRLPASIDAVGLQAVAKEVVSSYTRVVAQVQGSAVPSGDVVSMDLGVVAVSLLGQAWSPNGYSLLGYRWRLVARAEPDEGAFQAEVHAADLRLARWLQKEEE